MMKEKQPGYFNGTMLDCILMITKAAPDIAAHWQENFRDLRVILERRSNPVTRVVFVGSGTSSTSSLTARSFVERMSGLPVSVEYPGDFLRNVHVLDSDGLYVFVSQTGTSMVCRQAMERVKKLGYDILVISESKNTPMAAGNPSLILDCGIEEYPMRTVGYSATVLTEMVLGLELGLHYGQITPDIHADMLERIAACGSRQVEVVRKTMRWLNRSRRQMLRSDLIVFTGADELYGVALEGAMKVWETLQKASVGYELEEGLHGPNYGYDHRHCVIVLDQGDIQSGKARALKRYMAEVWSNGLLIGPEAADADDLELELPDPETACIDFATAVQTIAYRLALDEGRDLMRQHDNSRMEAYFRTHS